MKTKNDILEIIKTMIGNYTPVKVMDAQGNNSSFVACCVDYFFDGECDANIINDVAVRTGYYGDVYQYIYYKKKSPTHVLL